MTQIIPKGFKQTEIGVIPEDWRFKNLDDITNIVTDYVANGSFTSLKENVNYIYDEGYAKLIRLVDYNRGFKGDSVFIDKKGYNFLRKTKLYGGEIIISNVGANCGLIFRVPNLNLKMSLGPNSIMIKTNQNDTFYYYFLISNLGQNLLGNIKSGSAVPKFNKTDLKKLKLPIPPLPQQQKIAQILSSLDDKIELLEKQNKTLENIGQAIFKSWFVDFEPFSGELVESEMGMIPRGWRVGKIGDLANIKSGFAFKSADFSKEGINIIKIKNITDSGVDLDNSDFVNEKGLVSRAYDFELEQGDILVAMSGNTTGKIAMMPKFDGRFLLNQRAGKFFMKNKKDTGFIYFYLKTNNIGSLILQTAYGSAQPNIAGKDIENFDIIIPSNKELEKYESISNDLIDKININIYQIKTLSIIRDSLLPRLMNGKIKA